MSLYQPYPLAVAARYLRAKSRDSFISFISLVSMLGIALAVAVLMVVQSVMNGFEHELQQRILAMVSHATLTGADGPLDDWPAARNHALGAPGVLAAAPFVEGQGMAVAGPRFAGIGVRGVLPELEVQVSELGNAMRAGALEDLAPGAFNIVIGVALAEELKVEVGDEIVLLLAAAHVTPAGVAPRMRSFKVAGIFAAGMYEYDRGLAFVHMDDGARLFRTGGRPTSMSLKVADPYSAGRIVNEIALDLGGQFYISDWSRQLTNVFRSIAITKAILFVLLSMVIAVAAFNIVSTLVMVVREKRGDIAILRTFGAPPRRVMAIFALQGTAIGVIGTALGVGLGMLTMHYLDAVVGLIESVFEIDLLPAEIYMIANLPTQARVGEVAQICVLALVLAVAATLYPSLKAARSAPAEALRHE